MTSDRPNVIVLTMDAVRPDRMSLYGYDRPTTPVLDSLRGESLLCATTYSLAAFTQICFPSLMTSTRPLSYGGYDFGAIGRPKTLSKVFGDAGYHVTHISNVHWINQFYGYCDGVDENLLLFGLNTVVGACIATMRSTLAIYMAGEISEQEMSSTVSPVTEKLFDDLETFCDIQIANPPPRNLSSLKSGPVSYDGHNYAAVKRVIHEHKAEFKENRETYIHRHLIPVPKAHQWIANDWRYRRRPLTFLTIFMNRLANTAIGFHQPDFALLRNNRRKRYVDAAGMVDLAIRSIRRRDIALPRYLWLHFMDGHIPYCPGPGLDWYRHAPRYLKAIGYRSVSNLPIAFKGRPQNRKDWADWSAIYDATIRYMDEQIGRLIDELDRLGFAENTLIAFTGDHGEELGEHGDISHYFRLYDHNIRVPMLFHRRRTTGQTINGLTTALDFAPSVAALAGLRAQESWEGRPVNDAAVTDREHIMCETFFGGNCDFDRRALYFAIRSLRYKYIWKEFTDPEDLLSPTGNELYDLRVDPQEKDNLYDPNHPAVEGFNRLIAARMAEIPEISDERIAKAFGENTLAAAVQ